MLREGRQIGDMQKSTQAEWKLNGEKPETHGYVFMITSTAKSLLQQVLSNNVS